MATELRTDDLLLKIIARFDFYIGTTNAKAALVAAFNTFAIGAIVLKWGDVVALFAGHPAAAKGAAILLAVAALASVASLAAVFMMVKPYLDSPKAPMKYHSILFFGHVAEHGSATDYVSAVLGASEEDIVADLGAQAHALARGVRAKFRLMNAAVLALVLGELGAFAVILLMRLWTAVFG